MLWKTIKEAPCYMVSNKGHIKSCCRKVYTFNGKTWCYIEIPETYPLKEKDIRGYKNVSLIVYDEYMKPVKRYTKQVHRIVLENFLPVDNMSNLQINHIDGDKSNNHVSNLEWATPKENTSHSINVVKKHRTLCKDGENNSMSKLTNEKVIEIIKEVSKPNRKSDSKIALKYGVTRKTISHIRLNQTWQHIPRDIS